MEVLPPPAETVINLSEVVPESELELQDVNSENHYANDEATGPKVVIGHNGLI